MGPSPRSLAERGMAPVYGNTPMNAYQSPINRLLSLNNLKMRPDQQYGLQLNPLSVRAQDQKPHA